MICPTRQCSRRARNLALLGGALAADCVVGQTRREEGAVDDRHYRGTMTVWDFLSRR